MEIPMTRWLVFLLTFSALAVHAAEPTIEQKAATCAGCHGPNGQSANPQFPSLAGQTARYLYLELQDFQAGRRASAVMEPIAKSLSKDEMQALAGYFGGQRPMSSSYVTDAARVARGKALADASLCTMCHLGGFSGQNEVPRVAGQQYAYILQELAAFRDKRRTNDAGTMQAYARGLSDQDIDALAQYVTSLN
jgi:cytochrome c553